MIESLLAIFKESANSFQSQEEGEKVILLLRRFPFSALAKVTFTGASIFVPLILGISFNNFLYQNKLIELFWMATSLWALIAWLIAFYILTMYTLDVWILTDRRIIDATQQGLFNRTISELHLSRVQDASVHIIGLLPTVFGYGDLLIQTAGAEEHFKFYEIAHPELVKDAIMRAADAHPPAQQP
jgi:uncharacterized membrane protein YdbT with pleckstrin-like domain